MDEARPARIQLCDDEALGYVRSRTPLGAGQGLALDEAYRLAHLPLIAPDHPRVIAARDGAFDAWAGPDAAAGDEPPRA